MTIESEVAALTTATTQLLNSVNAKRYTLDNAAALAGAQVTLATAQANAAAANATQLATVNTIATTKAGDSAASATAAATARDLSIAAWASATAPAETLASMSQSVHYGPLVKVIIDDTSKHSDGGAWRKRCQHLSWYKDPLVPGIWRQQRASLAACWAVSGAAAGDYYRSTADGKFYQIGGTSGAPTQVEVYRGSKAEYPSTGLAVAQAVTLPRVVIYDAAVAGAPMWKVFTYTGKTITSIALVGGKLFVATTTGVFVEDLLADSVGKTEKYTASTSPAIVSASVNDIAVTVLENAPIDPATGLPVPTIAVATAGGVSVIKQDGTVVNGSITLSIGSVSIQDGNMLYSPDSIANGAGRTYSLSLAGIASSFTGTYYNYGSSVPSQLSTDWSTTYGATISKNCMAIRGNRGLSLLKENPATPTKGMVAYITNAYNSGWQIGDSRLCALSDAVAETITASELVTNGASPASSASWTPAIYGTNTASVSGGEFVFQTVDGLTDAQYTQNIATVVGKTYKVTMTGRTVGGRTVYAYAMGQYINTTSSTNTTGTVQFVATGTSTPLVIAAGSNVGGTSYVSFIGVKQIDADRSVKDNGLTIVGSLTKTAVATGAALVAYSGFSASNYFEQPYSANLDFNASDYCIDFWALASSDGGSLWMERRAYSSGYSGAGFRVAIYPNNGQVNLWEYNSAGGTVFNVDTSARNPGISGFSKYTLVRRGGTVETWVNGVLCASWVFAAHNMTNTSAIFRIGLLLDGTVPSSNPKISLLRISATAPSADQIAHIYRTELPLFQPGAQCTIAGTSTAVTAMAYDESTDLLHVGTSWGRTSFNGLIRVDSEATTVGAITSIAASGGTVIMGGTSANVYQPALALRDELKRKDEAKRALGKQVVFFDFDAATGQTAFTLQQGYTAKAVYSAEALKREGSTKAYTRSYDGFRETIKFAVAPGNAVWVSIMAVRS